MLDESGSDSSASSSTATSRATSVESTAATSPFEPSSSLHGGEPAEVTRLRLQREQKLRRMLSQRHLGTTEPIPHNAFFCTRNALGEEDLVWLYTLTNHHCFEQLLREVAATASTALAGHLDAVLSNANPLFHFNYRMPIEAAAAVAASGDDTAEAPPYLQESPLMQQWKSESYAIQRKRAAPEEVDLTSTTDKEGARKNNSTRKTAKKAAGASASSGLVAQSMMAWEAHLTASLTKEGETIENFRQARSKSSYTEKKSFQQQAEWNEFTREVALQQQQRDREATRALRRGETDE